METMYSKVYCIDCIHCLDVSHDKEFGFPYACNHPDMIIYEDSPYVALGFVTNIDTVNKGNSCNLYETKPSLLNRIKKSVYNLFR